MPTVHHHWWLERISRGSWNELRGGVRSPERIARVVERCALIEQPHVREPVDVGESVVISGRERRRREFRSR